MDETYGIQKIFRPTGVIGNIQLGVCIKLVVWINQGNGTGGDQKIFKPIFVTYIDLKKYFFKSKVINLQQLISVGEPV